MLSVIMLNVILLSAIMINVIMLSAIMIHVIMMNVIMLSVVMLKVMAPLKMRKECFLVKVECILKKILIGCMLEAHFIKFCNKLWLVE